MLRAASLDRRLLITLDRGLGDVRSYPPGAHAGILVMHDALDRLRGARGELWSAVHPDALGILNDDPGGGDRRGIEHDRGPGV